ncbi:MULTISPECIES: hypothetical protein [unclassified Streptomyces]|uniref:hypothetical protein n=1 Tax=unclassified Streptomyces TaxID=2593676 RepID=UPI003D7504E9
MSVTRRPSAALVTALALLTVLLAGAGAGLEERSTSGVEVRSEGPRDSAGWG